MKTCNTCKKKIPYNNGCPTCSRHPVFKTCYVTSVSGRRCDKPAPVFNMCDDHLALLEWTN